MPQHNFPFTQNPLGAKDLSQVVFTPSTVSSAAALNHN